MKLTFSLFRRKRDVVSRPLLSEDESKLTSFSKKQQQDSPKKNKACLSISETRSTSFSDDQSDHSSSVSLGTPTDEILLTVASPLASPESVTNESWRQHGYGVRLNIIQEELRNPKCELSNPALPAECYFDLGEKIFDTFTTTIRRSSDDTQLLLDIYLEAFVYAHRFHKLHSNVVFNHPSFYSQLQVHKCLRTEHLSRLNFVLSCIDELSERIDLLVYNDTLGENEAADVFKTILHRSSPWAENWKERAKFQQLDIEKTPEIDESALETEEQSDSDVTVGVEEDAKDPFQSYEMRFFDEKEAVKIDHSGNDTVDSDEVSEYNSPILKAEFEPYAGESLSKIMESVASPKLTPTISEPIRDTPPRLRRVRFTLSEANQSDASVVKEQTENDVFIEEPPVLKRTNHHEVSGKYARLIHKFEAMSSPTTHARPTLRMPQPNYTNNSDSHGAIKVATIESETGNYATSNVPFPATVTKTEVDPVSSTNGSVPTVSCRTPTRSLRTYRDCADTLKSMLQRSPCSTTSQVNNNSPRQSAEENERGLMENSPSFNTYGSGDESFDEVSFTGGRLYSNQVEVPSHVYEANNWLSNMKDGLHAPVPIRSSGRYKNLPDYVHSNS